MKKLLLLAVGLVLGTTMLAQFRLDVVGDAKIQGTLELTKEAGDSSIFIGMNAGWIDDGNNENIFIGADAGKLNIRGASNTFIGYKAGTRSSNSSRNSIFGHYAGKESEGWSNCFFGESSGANNNGAFNAFFGMESGLNNTNWNNSFFGYKTGKNSSGGNNVFMGAEAGKENVGEYNSFFGFNTGRYSNGDNNSFFGKEAGLRNEGDQNSFFGHKAGYRNNIGTNNTFIGHEAGRNETAHVNSTFLGANAGSNSDSLHQAIAIGHNASVSCDNCATIGGYGESAVSLGIGTGFPRAPLHILKSYSRRPYNKDYVAVFEDTTSAYIATLTNEERSSGIIFKQSQFGLSGGLLYNTPDNPDGLIVRNNSGNHLLVTAEGNVGIGETNPTTKLHLNGVDNDGTTAVLKITSSGQNMLLDGNEIDSDSDIHLNHNSNRHVYAARGGGDMVIGGLRQNIDSRLQVHGNAAKSAGGTTWATFSDRRLKKNIRPFEDGLETLLRIDPVRFQYNGRLNTSDKQEEIGIIAQDIQKVAPYMVDDFEHQDAKGRKENYLLYNSNALFYILVNSIKTVHQNSIDQEKTITEQTKYIHQLQKKYSDLEKQMTMLAQQIKQLADTKDRFAEEANHTIVLQETAVLSQNEPNPFYHFTNINYTIPNGIQRAMLRISNASGKVLKEHHLNKVGQGQIQIKTTHFPVGTYYYSLILDGQLFETKRMILVWK